MGVEYSLFILECGLPFAAMFHVSTFIGWKAVSLVDLPPILESLES